MADRQTLHLLYRQVLGLGQDVLAILSAPVSAQTVARLEVLVGQRKQLLQECSGLAGQVGPDEALLGVLNAVIKQQQQLEEAWDQRMEHLRHTSRQAHHSQQRLRSVNRLLSAGPRSRLMDQRR